jgi:WD40 repeat protein
MILSTIAALSMTRQGQDMKAAKPDKAKPAVEIKLAKDIEYYHPIAMAAAASGDQVAMTLDDNSVRIVDAATHGTLKTFTGHPQQPKAIAWSADGAWIATGDESARIFLWDARTGQKLRQFTGHTKGIQNLSFNLPRTMMLSTSNDDSMRMWDPLTGKCTKILLGGGANLYSGTFSPVTNSFSCGTLGSGTRIYDGQGNAKNFLTNVDVTQVNDVSFNSAGNELVSAGRMGSARLWDLKTMKPIGSVKGHGDWVVHARFSPNGRYLATSSTDRSIHVYDTKTLEKVADFENVSAVGAPLAWTGDGKFLMATAADDHLQIYSVTPPQAGEPVVTKPLKVVKAKGKKHHRRK